MGEGIALQLRDCLNEMLELEEGGGLHRVNVTLGADDAGEETREIACVGDIVGDLVPRFDAAEGQRLLRFSVGIPCGVRVRARGVGDCRGKCRRYIGQGTPRSKGDNPKSKSGGRQGDSHDLHRGSLKTSLLRAVGEARIDDANYSHSSNLLMTQALGELSRLRYLRFTRMRAT